MAKEQVIVDTINQRTISNVVHEYSAIVAEGLNSQEKACLDSVMPRIRGKRILDLGMGAGRTVEPLRAISNDYVGIDYVAPMVAHCRQQFPGVRFEQGDARALSQFADGSFELVFFSCNGISMVDHAGRLAILAQAMRVLSPQGVFIFSTCNRDSPEFRTPFRFPDFEPSINPARLAVRSARFAGQTAFRLLNRMKYTRHEVRCDEYAIVNDVCHHYQTMLYFIDIEGQLKQLRAAGFAGPIRVYDLSGRLIEDSSPDGTIAFVAEKSAAAQ